MNYYTVILTLTTGQKRWSLGVPAGTEREAIWGCARLKGLMPEEVLGAMVRQTEKPIIIEAVEGDVK